jgi:hypothetical protein
MHPPEREGVKKTGPQESMRLWGEHCGSDPCDPKSTRRRDDTGDQFSINETYISFVFFVSHKAG